MSIKSDIYSAVESAIQNITEIKTIALWNNQLEREKEEKPKAYPALFIEFSSMAWDTTNLNINQFSSSGNIKKEQKGKFTINCHICFSQLEKETASFVIIDPVIEKVYYAVHGLSGEFFGPLKRIEEQQDSEHDRMIHWIMSFDCGVFQGGEADSSLTLIEGEEIEMTINRDLEMSNKTTRTGEEE